MRLMKRYIAAALAFAITVCASIPQTDAVSIDDLQDKIEQIQKENEERQDKIESLKDDISQYEEYVEAVQEQINGVTTEIQLCGQAITEKQEEIDERAAQITTLEEKVAANEAQIDSKRIEIDALEEKNEKNLTTFGELVAAMYKSDGVDYISVLAESQSFYDLLITTKLMSNIAEQTTDFMDDLLSDIENQNQMISELETDIITLEQEKSEVQAEKKVLESEMDALQAEKEELSSTAGAKYDELYTYSSGIDSLESSVSTLKNEITASNEEVEEINKAITLLIQQESGSNSDVYSTDGFIWPLASKFKLITTYFGYDAWRGGNHYGIDVGNAGIGGAYVYAAQSGTVITAKNDGNWNGGYGNYVVIDHGNNISTLYAHMQTGSVTVSKGDFVTCGTIIGQVGKTGWATGNHLHFEVRVNGTAVDPFNYSYTYLY